MFFKGQIRAQILRILEEREHLLGVESHPHELLDEALSHGLGRVFLCYKSHPVQFEWILEIEFIFWHTGDLMFEVVSRK